MKVSYNWLREYTRLEQTPEELAEILTMGGLEVEGIERIGAPLKGVVVGRVTAVRPHPNADRLTLCDVDVGAGDPVQIACGAPNVGQGQLVPVATVGTTLMVPDRDDPDVRAPMTIRKAELRGEVSEGMICAEDELGLSDDHSGIMVLRESGVVGQPFDEYLRTVGIDSTDAVLDVSITPNRPDAACHVGVARDAAALTSTPLTLPEVPKPTDGGETAEQITVDIDAPDACPRYVAMVVRNVTVAESPAWLKARLTAIGLRPRNAVVDVTNFVLHELGQPLHAFDLDRIEDRRIRVYLTSDTIPFTTLDHTKRTIPAGTLMIADGRGDVAVAGVMGGANSEVTDATTNVLIESAYFDPSTIRKAAKAMSVQTDASYRFERGVDRDGQVRAAARAAALIAELGGGVIVPGVVDAHPVQEKPRRIDVRASRVDGLLGVRVPVDTATRLLRAIGFEIEQGGSDTAVLTCTVPSFRPDVEREVDVIEEIIRLYGYDNVPQPRGSTPPFTAPREQTVDRLRRRAREVLSASGFREIYTNSMLPSETADRFNRAVLSDEMGSGGVVETLNPISREMAALRPSLLPGALQVMSYNRKHGRRMLRFFEFGHVFRRTNRDDTLVDGYSERESFILAASGTAAASGWDVKPRTMDLFDAKGMVAALLEQARVPDLRMAARYERTDLTVHHLDVLSGDARLGLIAELAHDVRRPFDLDDPVFFAELDWGKTASLAAPHLERFYREVSRYPAVDRDLALTVDRGQQAGLMIETIREAGGDLLRRVEIFDLYAGEHVGEGRKSVAFSLRFGAGRTLTDEEVDERVAAIVAALENTHDASLRR